MGVKKINGLMKAMVENVSNANGLKYTTATGKHSSPRCWATTSSDQILVNLAVIAMSRASTAMLLHPKKHVGKCHPSLASKCTPDLSKVNLLTVFKSQRRLQVQARLPQFEQILELG